MFETYSLQSLPSLIGGSTCNPKVVVVKFKMIYITPWTHVWRPFPKSKSDTLAMPFLSFP